MKTTRPPRGSVARTVSLCAAALAFSVALAPGQTRSTRELPPARDTNPATVPVRDIDDDVRARRDVPDDADRSLKRADRSFMEKAARTLRSQIEISRIAAARTSNPDVRKLAQSMIENHQDALDELARLAAGKGVALPAKDPPPEKWETRNARNFDRDYLDQMVDDHEDVVRLFDKQARDGEDAETVTFARRHLARMQHHLYESIDLKRLLK